LFNGLPSPRDLPKKWERCAEILTDNPTQEIWNIFENLANIKYLDTIIRTRLERIANSKIGTNNQFDLIRNEYISDIVYEARNIIFQAKDIYFAAKSLSRLSKPILLFYSFEKLAQLIYIITFKEKRDRITHGLSYPSKIDGERTINIQESGLFQKFHSTFSSNYFYLDKPKIKFDDIINCGPLNIMKVKAYHNHIILYSLKNQNDTINKNTIQIEELDREFNFIYVLSILARYNVNEWSNLLMGKEILFSNEIKTINFIWSYLNTVENTFPNLILNEIYGKSISFFTPAMIMDKEIEEYDDKAL
jgi:hypothetical protein